MGRGGEQRSTKKRPRGAVYYFLENKKLILNYRGERLRTGKKSDFSFSPNAEPVKIGCRHFVRLRMARQEVLTPRRLMKLHGSSEMTILQPRQSQGSALLTQKERKRLSKSCPRNANS